MLVLNLPFKALMFLTLMRPSLVLFLVLWLKLVKDFLKVRCRLALLPFLISCLIWLDLVASLPLIKERILVIILLLHFLSLMLGSVLVLMLPLLVWLTPDLIIKKSLQKCNWTIRKRLRRCKMRLKKRLLAFSRRLHGRIRKTRYMHKMRCLLIKRRSLLLALRLLWKTPIFPSNSRFPRLCAKCLLKLKRLVSILPMTKSNFFFLMIRLPPRSTLFPYTTLFRSVFLTGSYKKPREFNWVVGVLLLVLTLLLSFTGYLLPDDQLGFWAVTVGTNMARATPLLGHDGPFGPQLGMTPFNDVRFGLLGGSIVDSNALLRAYIWHCVAIPIIASLFMIVHFWRVRKDGGISGPAPMMLESEIKEQKKV